MTHAAQVPVYSDGHRGRGEWKNILPKVLCYWHIIVSVTVNVLIVESPLIRANEEGREHAVCGSLCAHTERVWCRHTVEYVCVYVYMCLRREASCCEI